MATHTKAETNAKPKATRSMAQTETALPTQVKSSTIGHLSGGTSAPPFNPSDVFYLQRSMGNRAVQRYIQRQPLARSTTFVQRTPDGAPMAPPIRVSQRAGVFTI